VSATVCRVPVRDDLSGPATAIARQLRERSQTVAVAESSAGGLISAALLAVPGSSAYYLGGVVIYTLPGAKALLGGAVEPPEGMRGASEPFARWLASSGSRKLGADWAVSETGAAGPSGNPYGDPAGHAWVAVSGPGEVLRSERVGTGSDDREANMVAFAAAALALLLRALDQSPPARPPGDG
jgi:nicotinamide-nucleotide amidase